MLAWRARADADCAAETECVSEAAEAAERRRWERKRANLAKTRRMARRKTAAPKRQRRPRAEIDRNYFLGDVFIKTGVAVVFAIAAIMLYAPAMWRDALAAHHYAYPILLGSFAAAGAIAFVTGRHLRNEATQWDLD